jgi:hypothetical protein
MALISEAIHDILKNLIIIKKNHAGGVNPINPFLPSIFPGRRNLVQLPFRDFHHVINPPSDRPAASAKTPPS